MSVRGGTKILTRSYHKISEGLQKVPVMWQLHRVMKSIQGQSGKQW